MTSIAFFDVDGTLLKGYSGYYTTLELIRRKIIKKRRLPGALFYKIISPFYYVDKVRKMYEVAIADMAGLHIDEALKIGRETFEKHLKPRLYREALEEIEKLKKRGHKIIVISSGPTMAIRMIEEYVGADTSFSIGPVIENNILQNRLKEPLAFLEGKVEIAQEQVRQSGITLKDCSFYADSFHDIHLLSAVGNPQVVNPDRKLKKEALRRGWSILEFKTLLGK